MNPKLDKQDLKEGTCDDESPYVREDKEEGEGEEKEMISLKFPNGFELIVASEKTSLPKLLEIIDELRKRFGKEGTKTNWGFGFS